MMNHPKIIDAKPVKPYVIEVVFSNNVKKYYDFQSLLKMEIFYPLNDYSFFKSFRISSGGYGLEWNDEIDISEYELWTNSYKFHASKCL
jgi:hypothetical protein